MPTTPGQSRPLRCDEVLATARGRDGDPRLALVHLAGCPGCREALTEIDLVVQGLGEGLGTAPDDDAPRAGLLAARVLAAARGPQPLTGFGTRIALAAASLVALVLLAGTALDGPSVTTSDPTIDIASAGGGTVPDPLVREPQAIAAEPVRLLEVEVLSPDGGRLPFELRTVGGVEQGELDLNTHYVLDTVPARAVVVDTF